MKRLHSRGLQEARRWSDETAAGAGRWPGPFVAQLIIIGERSSVVAIETASVKLGRWGEVEYWSDTRDWLT